MCLSPITIKVDSPFSSGYRQVPCGHCLECLKDYQNSWKIRIIEECKCHKDIYFCTFTYRDEFNFKTLKPKSYKFNRRELRSIYYNSAERLSSIPDTLNSCIPHTVVDGEVYLSVSRLHWQNLIKRFRTNYTRENKGKLPQFKYFVCSEYGPASLRPHYHAIFFGLDYESVCRICDDWYLRHGHVDLSAVATTHDGVYVRKKSSTSAVGNYVSKYCSKGVLFENPAVELHYVAPTFRFASKHLGEQYIINNLNFHLQNDFKSLYKSSKPEYGLYSSDYLESVRCHMRYCDPLSPDFTYKLPRYYQTKILDSRVEIDETGKKYLVKCSSSKNPLHLAYSLYLSQFIDDLYLQKYFELQTQNPTWSDSEIIAYMETSEQVNRKNRGDVLYSRLKKFYSQSKL